MIKKSIVTIALGLAFLGTAGAKEINILFMGNSFTFRHDLPDLVKAVFEEGQADLTVNVDRVVYGGQDLFRHHDFYFSQSKVRQSSITVPEIEAYKSQIKAYLDAGTAPEFYDAYWQKTGLKPVAWSVVERNLKVALKRQSDLMDRIEKGDRPKWDYLVLQSWKDVVDSADAGYAEYAQKFAKLAAEEGIKVILYVTAPEVQNPKPVEAPVNVGQTEMEMRVARQLAEIIQPYAVVPVALGIQQIQEDGTDLTFCYVNDFHPNQYCAFLTANMFYAAFFKESPEGFQFNTVVETNDKGMGKGKDPDGGNAKVVFDEETKLLLQRTAYESVVTFNAGLE